MYTIGSIETIAMHDNISLNTYTHVAAMCDCDKITKLVQYKKNKYKTWLNHINNKIRIQYEASKSEWSTVEWWYMQTNKSYWIFRYPEHNNFYLFLGVCYARSHSNVAHYLPHKKIASLLPSSSMHSIIHLLPHWHHHRHHHGKSDTISNRSHSIRYDR